MPKKYDASKDPKVTPTNKESVNGKKPVKEYELLTANQIIKRDGIKKGTTAYDAIKAWGNVRETANVGFTATKSYDRLNNAINREKYGLNKKNVK